MNQTVAVIAGAILAILPTAGRADPPAVVINEIFYHAPDDLDDLQFIELHNPGPGAVNLAGWKLARAVRYEFSAKASIAAGGYVVLCKEPRQFKAHYGFDAAGTFAGSLTHSGDRIDLLDAKGKKVDGVKYKTRAPWPVAADGSGSSLERICPTAPGDDPGNWAPSPLPDGPPRPGGTPGKKNAAFAVRRPPDITDVTFTPSHAAPGQEIRVEAAVRSDKELGAVELRYRVAGSGSEGKEQAVPMTGGPSGRYTASIPGQKAGQLVRFRIRATDAAGGGRFFPDANELQPALSCYVHEPFRTGQVPFGLIINVHGEAQSQNTPARGSSAFVYVRPGASEPELFDFINVTPRKGGRKVRFHKDRPLDGMTTINLIYEDQERFVLAEPLAYEVYFKAGNAAPRTDFVRTWVDGQPIGYQLLIEQPNKAFLRHNGLNADGNLYKCQWFGDGLIGQHEKKTHTHEGHDDLVALVRQLTRTQGDEQWAVIKKNIDAEQVATFYAVHMLVSDWDGFFNNHYVYHDTRGTGKWTMYPWDQDKTWGFHDGIGGYDFFYDMPLTFGMTGDVPVGGAWWRPPGHLSGPLLANPHFRKLFLARTKELLEKVYTKEVFFPLIDRMGERLREEVEVRAKLHGEDPRRAAEHLRRNLDSLRQHLVKRRQFLLERPEIKAAGAFDRSELK